MDYTPVISTQNFLKIKHSQHEYMLHSVNFITLIRLFDCDPMQPKELPYFLEPWSFTPTRKN